MPSLLQTIDGCSAAKMLPRDISGFVLGGLNPAFELREYQKEAFARFLFYLSNDNLRARPTQLLFHMATGSGKTLVMAAAILHLYEQGYRNFLFFVNSTNIIEKTKGNFLNPLSPKYLFAGKIVLDGREIAIREASNFQATSPDDITIVFSTIQGLHTRLNTPSENSLTYDDFADRKIVLVSDEAHHINTLTKQSGKLSKEEKEEASSWEGTVDRIFQLHPENIMLEFTATVETGHPAVKQKYEDKILFEYSLKQFREDGFSKDVEVLQANLEPMDRALQAIVVSQYRRKVAERHGLHIKPVVLFKSKTIHESQEFEKEFHDVMGGLNAERLTRLRDRGQSDVTSRAFAFFERNGIALGNLVRELQEDFPAARCRAVNSSKDCEQLQVELNELEKPGNEVRAVFVVDMLNEGWDVLNLFDIVRLYETRDAKAGQPGQTTIKEAQLIGRGARYCPFQLSVEQDRFKRKYDGDAGNELRVLEELHYHSSSNPRYIQELHKALVQTGIMPERARTIKLSVKNSFKQTEFWQRGHLYLNERVTNTRDDVLGLNDMHVRTEFTCELRTGFSRDVAIFGESVPVIEQVQSQRYKLSTLGVNVLRKAVSRNDFYRFDRLKRFFPHLKSITEFITSDTYLGRIDVDVKGHTYDIGKLTSSNALRVASQVIAELAPLIKGGTTDHKGTKDFKPQAVSATVKDKELHIVVSDAGDQEYGIGMRETTNRDLHLDLSKHDWYVYDENFGTSEEKSFVKFIQSAMRKLNGTYQNVYLLRNEKLFQLYRFSDGAAVEADFVLFALERDTGKQVIHQVFVETKGGHLRAQDEWKEEFLKQIEKEHRITTLFKGRKYKLIGMPFYGADMQSGFAKEFNRALGVAD